MKIKTLMLKKVILLCTLLVMLGCQGETTMPETSTPQVIGVCCDLSSSLDSLSIVKMGEKCASLIGTAAPGSTLRFTLAEQNTYLEPLLIFTKATTEELADPLERFDAEEIQEIMQKEIKNKLNMKFKELRSQKDARSRQTCLINAIMEAANWTQRTSSKDNAYIYVFSDMREECSNGPFGKIYISNDGVQEKMLKQIKQSKAYDDLKPIKKIHLNITNMDNNANNYTEKLKQFWMDVIRKLGAQNAPIWEN